MDTETMLQKVRGLSEKNIILAQGKNKEFYYLYYVGMGSMGFHKLPETSSILIKVMVLDSILNVSEELIGVPVHLLEADRMVIAVFYKILPS